MLLLAVHVALAADCAAPTTNEDLVVALGDAVRAYGELDRTGFEASLRAAKEAVDCLGEVIEPSHAAELHRATGLSAFLARDEDLAKTRFAAARRIEPAYTFPDTLVPEGNPVRELYQGLDPAQSPVDELPPPAAGSLRLDGRSSRERRTLLPTVFQRLDGQGAVLESSLLNPGVPAPAYEQGKVDDRAKPTKAKRGPSVPLLAVAGVVAAGAIGTYVGSHVSRSGYDKHVQAGGPNPDFTDTANAKRSTTNALVITSVGLGIAAAGTGAVAMFAGTF